MTATSAVVPSGVMNRPAELTTIVEAINEMVRERPVVVVDAGRGEKGSDLVISAEHVTAEAVSFSTTHPSSLICVPMRRDRFTALRICPMSMSNSDVRGTTFCAASDHCIASKDISAVDRAAAIRSLADPASTANDFARPGHLFLFSGVRERPGYTNSVDLVVPAGSAPAAVIRVIASADGRTARLPELLDFAAEHTLQCVSIQHQLAKRRAGRSRPPRVTDTQLSSGGREFRAVGYLAEDGQKHIALALSEATSQPPLARLRSEYLTGDVLASQRCYCGAQLARAKQLISDEGHRVLVYLRGHDGRGVGLTESCAPTRSGRRARDEDAVGGHARMPGSTARVRPSSPAWATTQVRLLSNSPHTQPMWSGARSKPSKAFRS